jgi:two-component system response regulator NreC
LLAIRSVARGNRYFSPEVSEGAVETVVWRSLEVQTLVSKELSNREREVLQLIAEGLSNQRIADELSVSVKTVEAHKTHIMGKLQPRTPTDLVRYAMKRGLLGFEPPAMLDGAVET